MDPFRTIRRLLVVAALAGWPWRRWPCWRSSNAGEQERVTALARPLHVAVKDVRQAVRREPVDGVLKENRVRGDLLQTLRVVEKSASQLAMRSLLAGRSAARSIRG